MPSILGLDIGGANLKVSHSAGRACHRAFALWKAPERLADELRALMNDGPPCDRLAVTMTGELCDCFESQRQGILHILDAVERVAEGKPISVWTNQGTFVTLAQARANPLPAASANWLALATLAGQRHAPPGPSLLIDIGTTTTDIIPLMDGKPVPKGRTDALRFASGELVYLGWRRTPLCALSGTSRAAEFYATTLDAFLVLKILADKATDCDTADGRPATHAAANRRLSRMLGGDLETITQRARQEYAEEIRFKVVNKIARAVDDVVKQMPGMPKALIVSGTGEFLVKGVCASVLFPREMKACPVVSLFDEWGDAGSAAACATAVAFLCAEQGDA